MYFRKSPLSRLLRTRIASSKQIADKDWKKNRGRMQVDCFGAIAPRNDAEV